MTYVLKHDQVGARILAVACAEPLSVHELTDRVDARFGMTPNVHDTMRQATAKLAERGFLHIARSGRGHKPSLYVLTRQGERELDRLFRMARAA